MLTNGPECIGSKIKKGEIHPTVAEKAPGDESYQPINAGAETALFGFQLRSRVKSLSEFTSLSM